MSERLQQALELIDEDPDAAYALCQEEMQYNPDSHGAYYLAGTVLTKAEKHGIALSLFERSAKLAPTRAEAWNAVGTVLHELKRPAEAREAFRRALDLKKEALYYVNLGVTYSDEGNHAEAIRWIKRAEKIDPDLPNIPAALCFAELATGDWENGWRHWNCTLGGKFRKKQKFAPDWDGSPVDRLIVYGEQGLGDEIMYGSCINDVRSLAKHVDIECDPRLEGLFKRSFPWASVHGSRRLDKDWNTQADAQVACGSLPEFFRPTPESCPKTPYLTADPERRLMWRTLFDSWKKPVIGLCWTGGRFTSQAAKRAIGLEAFRNYIETRDAVYVSLQYKDPREEIKATGLPVRYFPAMTSDDYDDAAALVAELDHIVGIHTTVHHLAGALGKASTILVPHAPMWNYAYGDGLPWYANQSFHRQKKDERWTDCLKRLD